MSLLNKDKVTSRHPKGPGVQQRPLVSHLNLGPTLSYEGVSFACRSSSEPESVVLGEAPDPGTSHSHLPHGAVHKLSPAIVISSLSLKLGGLVDHQRGIPQVIIDPLDGADIFNFKVLNRSVSEDREGYLI